MIVDLLCSLGVNFHARDKLRRVPLHFAAAMGHFDTVARLIGYGSDAQLADVYGRYVTGSMYLLFFVLCADTALSCI